MLAREPIFAALFAKLAASAGFITSSRKLRHWADVSPAEQPALFTSQGDQSVSVEYPQPGRTTLTVDVYIYVRADGDPLPGKLLNNLIDAVTTALAPDNLVSEVQTLGGLVDHCWIEGSIKIDEGVMDSQAVAIVPIKILHIDGR